MAVGPQDNPGNESLPCLLMSLKGGGLYVAEMPPREWASGWLSAQWRVPKLSNLYSPRVLTNKPGKIPFLGTQTFCEAVQVYHSTALGLVA